MPDRYKKVQDYYLVVLNVMGSSPIGHPSFNSKKPSENVDFLWVFKFLEVQYIFLIYRLFTVYRGNFLRKNAKIFAKSPQNLRKSPRHFFKKSPQKD